MDEIEADQNSVQLSRDEETKLIFSRLTQYGLNESQVRMEYSKRYCASEEGMRLNATHVDGSFRYNELPLVEKLAFITQYGEEHLEFIRLMESE